jgi:hypothetical protein
MPCFSAVEIASIAQIGYWIISLHFRILWMRMRGLSGRPVASVPGPAPETRKERASIWAPDEDHPAGVKLLRSAFASLRRARKLASSSVSMGQQVGTSDVRLTTKTSRFETWGDSLEIRFNSILQISIGQDNATVCQQLRIFYLMEDTSVRPYRRLNPSSQ